MKLISQSLVWSSRFIFELSAVLASSPSLLCFALTILLYPLMFLKYINSIGSNNRSATPSFCGTASCLISSLKASIFYLIMSSAQQISGSITSAYLLYAILSMRGSCLISFSLILWRNSSWKIICSSCSSTERGDGRGSNVTGGSVLPLNAIYISKFF